MKHPLECENEELKKRIEDAYNEIERTEMEIMQYGIYDMVNQVTSNSILANAQTMNDIMKWSNGK